MIKWLKMYIYSMMLRLLLLIPIFVFSLESKTLMVNFLEVPENVEIITNVTEFTAILEDELSNNKLFEILNWSSAFYSASSMLKSSKLKYNLQDAILLGEEVKVNLIAMGRLKSFAGKTWVEVALFDVKRKQKISDVLTEFPENIEDFINYNIPEISRKLSEPFSVSGEITYDIVPSELRGGFVPNQNKKKIKLDKTSNISQPEYWKWIAYGSLGVATVAIILNVIVLSKDETESKKPEISFTW